MSTRHETNHKVSRNTRIKIGSNAFEKKKRLCPFLSAKAGRKNLKNRFARIGMKT